MLLIEAKSTPSEIIDKPTVPIDGIYDVTSFKEMTEFGCTGSELDRILETAEKEGLLKQHRDTMKLIRGYHQTKKTEKPKEKWWKKLVA
jgi:hypothetical protein